MHVCYACVAPTFSFEWNQEVLDLESKQPSVPLTWLFLEGMKSKDIVMLEVIQDREECWAAGCLKY